MTIKGGTSQACAACKYQRRRCSKDCALAPYFPADQPKMFQNAHRLFGVRNIMRILTQVPPSKKDETMTSIIFESNMRSRFPVHGCCGVIWQLEYQIHQVSQELSRVRTKVAMMNQNQIVTNDNDNVIAADDSVYSAYTQQHHEYFVNQASIDEDHDPLLLGNVNGGIYVGYINDERIQQHYNDNYGINMSNVESAMMLMQANLIPGGGGGGRGSSVDQYDEEGGSHSYPLQQEVEISHDYDDGLPYETIVDDRQSYVESKDPCNSRYVLILYISYIFST